MTYEEAIQRLNDVIPMPRGERLIGFDDRYAIHKRHWWPRGYPSHHDMWMWGHPEFDVNPKEAIRRYVSPLKELRLQLREAKAEIKRLNEVVRQLSQK